MKTMSNQNNISKTDSIPNMIEVNKLEQGDIIMLQFSSDVSLEYPSIVNIDPENRTATLLIGQNELKIVQNDQWAQLRFAPVFDQLLVKIGFIPSDLNMAYGSTNSMWVKNESGITWTLEYKEENSTWMLTRECADMGQVITPNTYDDNIIFIHQIQHCLRNPEIMKGKNTDEKV